jgi:hypothetical protein
MGVLNTAHISAQNLGASIRREFHLRAGEFDELEFVVHNLKI